MKIKTIIKAVILLLLFIGALISFSSLSRVHNVDFKGTMEEATMPVVRVCYKDYTMGMLHGYDMEMNISSMHFGLIPVPDDRNIRLIINTYGRQIDRAEFQIRELDQTGYIDNGTLTSINDDTSEYFISNMQVANILEKGRQYALIFTVVSGDDTYYYYTRLLENAYEYLDECIDFAWTFHESSFDKDRLSDLSVYIEPDGSDSTDLSHVTIHSPLTQIGWGELTADVFGGANVILSEVTDHYNVINIDYVLMMRDEHGDISYYNVDEYYRVRYGADVERCYLLSYDRRMNKIFDAQGNVWSDGGINLGICDEKPDVIKSGSKKTICFSLQGDLWELDMNTEILTKIFSFRNFSGYEERENYSGHKTKPLKVDEDGSVTFAVYGYMNRGIHEGEVGIAIYSYDSLTGMNTELMFIPDSLFEDALIADIGDIIYANDNGKLFIHLHESIYEIDLKEKKYERLSNTADVFYVDINEKAKKLVWQDVPGKELYYLDLEKEKLKTFEKNTDSYVKMIGFLDNDYVYSVSEKDTLYMDDGRLPATEVNIIGAEENEVIKNYSKKKTYMTDIAISDYTVELERASLNDGEYEYIDSDSIVNELGEELIKNEITEKYDEEKQTIKIIYIDDKKEKIEIKYLNASEEILENIPVSRIETDDSDYYYIYSEGVCKKKTKLISEAVNFASANNGTIVKKTSEIWSRGKRNNYGPVESETIEKTLRANVDYELENVSLSDALGFVSKGALMQARIEDADVLVTGYDSNYIYVYNDAEKISEKMNLNDAQILFGRSGNKFKITGIVK